MAITKLISILSALAFSNMALGQQVPNTFQPGNPIVASEVNANFDALEAEIAVLKAQVETLQSNNASGREFVGATTAKTNGDANGLYSMNQMCAAEFSGSSTCQSDELLGPNTNLIIEASWVQPRIREYITEGLVYYGHPPAVSRGLTRDCFSWTFSIPDPNETGFVLQTNGRIETGGLCNVNRPVACCK